MVELDLIKFYQICINDYFASEYSYKKRITEISGSEGIL